MHYLIIYARRIPNYKKKENVHITKLPDQFRGKFRYDDEEAGLKYAQEVRVRHVFKNNVLYRPFSMGK